MVDSVQATQNATATSRGTRIVKKGNELDKDAFLKILVAELTNQDPLNAQDTTAYISQLAQFTDLEQMKNLNNTMTFNSASDLIGKTVALDKYDEHNRQYFGIVKDVNKNGENITITVSVPEYNGDTIVDYKDLKFDYGDVSTILNGSLDEYDKFSYLINNMSYLNSNINFMAASSIIGKQVQVNDDYFGRVSEVVKAAEGIKLKLILDDGTESECYYNDITSVK